MATVKHPCWESYRRIGDKTKASLRRVLHRVFRLNLTSFTVNGGVYEPLAARIARSYPITLYNFLSQVGSSRAFGVSEVAQCAPTRFLRSDSRRVRRT